MGLIEQLYPNTKSDLQMIWGRFLEFDPKTPLLGKEARKALRHKDLGFPLDVLRFNLFPDEAEAAAAEAFRECMNRGIRSVNGLCQRHLDATVATFFQLPEIPSPLDLFEVMRIAVEKKEQSKTHGKITKPELYAEAYASLRAIGLGYRTGMIDRCPWVLHSLRYFNQVTSRLENLLEPERTEMEGEMNRWETKADVFLFSTSDQPMGARVKYLESNDPNRIKYDSILMKMFLKGMYPEEIKDYIGFELMVADEKAQSALVDYFRRKTRVVGTFEEFKDTRRGLVNANSGKDYQVVKFILRIPARAPLLQLGVTEKEVYERVPIEVQILTLENARKREEIPEARHTEYKRRQFLRVFPAWYPQIIYEPLLRAQFPE